MLRYTNRQVLNHCLEVAFHFVHYLSMAFALRCLKHQAILVKRTKRKIKKEKYTCMSVEAEQFDVFTLGIWQNEIDTKNWKHKTDSRVQRSSFQFTSHAFHFVKSNFKWIDNQMKVQHLVLKQLKCCSWILCIVYCILNRAMDEIGYFENWYHHICICNILGWLYMYTAKKLYSNE